MRRRRRISPRGGRDAVRRATLNCGMLRQRSSVRDRSRCRSLEPFPISCRSPLESGGLTGTGTDPQDPQHPAHAYPKKAVAKLEAGERPDQREAGIAPIRVIRGGQFCSAERRGSGRVVLSTPTSPSPLTARRSTRRRSRRPCYPPLATRDPGASKPRQPPVTPARPASAWRGHHRTAGAGATVVGQGGLRGERRMGGRPVGHSTQVAAAPLLAGKLRWWSFRPSPVARRVPVGSVRRWRAVRRDPAPPTLPPRP